MINHENDCLIFLKYINQYNSFNKSNDLLKVYNKICVGINTKNKINTKNNSNIWPVDICSELYIEYIINNIFDENTDQNLINFYKKKCSMYKFPKIL